MTTETRSREEFLAAKANIENAVSSILARIDAENENVTNLGQTLKILPRGVLIHVEIKSDTRASIDWFVGSFKSIQITLDRWSGNSVRRSVKINGLALPDGAKAKIEEKVRELVAIALKREADRAEAQKAAEARTMVAFEARLEARDAGFSPRPRYGDIAPRIDTAEVEYEFGDPAALRLARRVEVHHSRQGAEVKLSLTFPTDQLLTALEFAQAVYERMPK